MQISKLVYNAIKNVVYYDDVSFTYEQFIEGKFNDDPDYATNIRNVFAPLNEAIARLSDLERIPYRVDTISANKDGIIDLKQLDRNVKEVISLSILNSSTFYKIPHRVLGNDKVLAYGNSANRSYPLYIEYKEDIPYFTEDNLPKFKYDTEGNLTMLDFQKDYDLVDYGITESMINYIMEYIQGKLLEPIAAELANMHITRAETYFSNISSVKSAFVQEVVHKTFRIGE